ncbi:hypothetical protein FIA58_017875 [Flavobacterium jejuense]|uniref:Histidine kinase N-terminal 7TM region domain-containing protein n=1 Tax=Flavobacterium jejuense TaxID=1544455 RepID=A0ABX0IXS3_9FLAO|nr:hypothetical protein [Flavobacterium jejuense]NHN27552.1 hypothetical protein [Flavobacterium jejuense]
MLENLRYIPGLFAFITTIIGLLNWSKLPNYKSKLFLLSVILSVFTEISAIYFPKWTGLQNYFIYDIYTLILFLIYYFILSSIMRKYTNKIIAFAFIILYLISTIFSLIYNQNKIGLEIIPEIYALSVLFLVILSILYLIELFNSSNILNYKKSIFFWFILGSLLFHVPFLPFMLTLKWWFLESETYGTTIYWIIIIMLNLIMNSCFTIGFIWTEKKHNY